MVESIDAIESKKQLPFPVVPEVQLFLVQISQLAAKVGAAAMKNTADVRKEHDEEAKKDRIRHEAAIQRLRCQSIQVH